ncbi:STAS domain-containing protein [Kitasatospora sp. NPDC085879]|jgi:anti-anti-sigma factor|uniref:STAS domain-containing protein n=1 Tax=Kitasatospora sp. NPDC085879 TaxID=3154769 RepID=UPI000BB0D1D2|nr:STAS domain-containing protein [Streptomyces sp. TLI_235]PBC71247.1 anti-anti-sigma factor [Streptomyces sp. TLI_235]
MEPENGQLTVAVQHSAHAVVVRPEGELDRDGDGAMREALEQAVAASPDLLVVDCGGLTFCDSAGLDLIFGAREVVEMAGGALVLAEPGPAVSGLLEIAGADDVLRVYGTVAEALAAGEH